jgi:hypothetical protein
MNASLLAVLNDAERLLVAETERAQLAVLDEDPALTGEREAAGKHPRHGCPAAGEAGQPMTTGRCTGRSYSRLNRFRWGPVGGRGAPGRHGHVSELSAEHILADLAGGCEREAAREQPAGGIL